MENDKTDNSGASASHDASVQNNGITFIGIAPRNRHRSNLGRSSQNLTRHQGGQSNFVRENGATAFPNIRFRSTQQNDNPAQSMPVNDRVSSVSLGGLADNTSNIGVGSGSNITRTRNRAQGGTRTATRNSSTSGTAPKGRNGSSPRRNNGRSSHNASTSNRSRGSYVMTNNNDDDTFNLDSSTSNPSRGSFMNRFRSGEPVNLDEIMSMQSRHALGIGGISGLGTEEQPFELLNESDVLDTEYSGGQSVTRDEEIARQLQQEEWERASTPAAVGSRAPDRLRFLQAVHGALGGDIPENIPRRRNNMVRLPGSRNPRGGFPRAALQLPDLLDILPPELMDIILSNGDGLEDDNDYEALLEIGEQIGAVNRGLSQADIDRIPAKKHKPSSSDGAMSSQAAPPQCAICLSEFDSGDTKRILPCHHDLHKDCIDKWLKTNATCPICRQDVREGRL